MIHFNYNCPKSVIIIVLFIGIMVLILGTRTLYMIVHRKLFCTEKIQATIYYKDAGGSVSETRERLIAVLKYKIDSVEYVVQDMFSVNFREYEEGEVYIFYNPQKPKEFLLPQKHIFKHILMSCFLVVLGLFFSYISIKILLY